MKRFVLAALAALVVSVGSMSAHAQDFNPNQGIKHVGATIAPTNQPIQLVAIAHGLALQPEEANIALQNDCFVGPMNLTRELYDKAAKKRVKLCSPRFYAMVDDVIGKESTIGFVLARVADGWEHCPIRKASNRGNNRDRCVNYPFDASHNPAGMVGRFADANWSTGGDTATTDALVVLGGAAMVGPVAAVASNVTAPKCPPGGCGPQVEVVTFNEVISGSWSNAQQSNHQAANAAANVTAPASGCGTALCVPKP